MFARRFSPLCVLFALATATLPATAAPPQGPSAPSSLDPSKAHKKPLSPPKAVRVRMVLEVIHATDGDGANTEDEIYYFLVLPQVGETLKIKEMRRSGDPDVFAMGLSSNRRLSRWLFRGEVSATNPMKLGLVIAEQDPSEVSPNGRSGGGEVVPFDSTLLPGMNEAASRAADRDHQQLSFLQITTSGSKLVVKTRDPHPGAQDKLLSATDDYAKVRLSSPGNYFLHVYLEPDNGPAPKALHYLGDEDDDCGPNESLYVKSTSGDIPIATGAVKTLGIGQQEFTWYCGGTEESSVARPNTDVLEVVREIYGDSILWRCFKRLTLSPDITR